MTWTWTLFQLSLYVILLKQKYLANCHLELKLNIAVMVKLKFNKFDYKNNENVGFKSCETKIITSYNVRWLFIIYSFIHFLDLSLFFAFIKIIFNAFNPIHFPQPHNLLFFPTMQCELCAIALYSYNLIFNCI